MPGVLTKNHHPMRNSYTPVRRPTPAASRKKSTVAVVAQTLDLNAGAMRKALIWIMGLGVVLLTFLGMSVGLMQLYKYCTTSEYFVIDDIKIEGTQQINSEDILLLSGLKTGENSLRVHIPDLEQRLLQNPWVENVSIKRVLPNKFVIQIQERIPQFWVLRDGTLHYLDAKGLVIAPVESDNFLSLPTLDIGPGGEEAVAFLSQFMTKLRNADIPFDPSQISWLRISAGKGFELYWENKQLSLSVGIENWPENLHRLGLVIKDMENRNEISMTREIRAADGQVWLHKV